MTPEQAAQRADILDWVARGCPPHQPRLGTGKTNHGDAWSAL